MREWFTRLLAHVFIYLGMGPPLIPGMGMWSEREGWEGGIRGTWEGKREGHNPHNLRRHYKTQHVSPSSSTNN